MDEKQLDKAIELNNKIDKWQEENDSQTVLDLIKDEMDSDTDSYQRESGYLLKGYKEADEAGRKAIDDALIAICGWSMETLIDRFVERFHESGVTVLSEPL